MSRFSHWLSVRGLVEATRSLKKPSSPAGASAPVNKPAAKPAPLPPRADPPPQAQPAKPATAKVAEVVHPPGRLAPFEHDTPDEPTLAQKHRPDLQSADVTRDSLHGDYHSGQKVASMRHMRGKSSNVNFHTTMGNGTSFVSKPHGGADESHESDKWGSRHEASYGILSHMGANHMALPGFESTVHSKVPGADPDDDDSPEKRLRMAKTHAGGKTHVVKFEPNHTPVADATPEQLDKVDGDHRLHGMVMHLLQSNADGHNENVLIHKSGHPILIDHDLSFDSSLTNLEKKDSKGVTGIRSVFAPGGSLDYTKKHEGEIGTDFPPRMRKTLEWLALNGHEKGEHKLGLSPGDSAELTKNARDLLKHGLEKTLARRKILTEHT